MRENAGYAIEVKVHPRSSKRRIEVREDGVHLYTTRAPVQDGANKDALDLLCECLDVPRRDIVLFRGQKSRRKIFHIAKEALGGEKAFPPETGVSTSIRMRVRQYVREV